ncbi:MAG: hypothetical protein KME25_29830 [Symplocastrum torsivum CPER-KK1]|jgi:hypothetical protein|uniref:Uncharacterized protein n=1 Tax=Symplocastrum torsivum CPER-KK1 TaxID=450513 RepID=A0A951PRX2_9CYAN|nr:hypothetical protein [Symplocastrum torsivum CPER-KK1]
MPATMEVCVRWGRQEIAHDEALGFERVLTPTVFPYLEDTPQAREYYLLAQRIKDVALFNFSPQNDDQAGVMRNEQHYWQCKSILLANKILKVFPDHTQLEDLVQQLLSERSFKRLQIDVAAYLSLYYLLKAGESEIKDWAKPKGIDYPFKDFLQLFIHILKTNFDYSYQNVVSDPNPLWFSKRAEKDRLRRWIKFFADHYSDDEQEEQKYINFLMDTGWEGYSLLVLKNLKRIKPFGQLWNIYLKFQRARIKAIDDVLYWKDNIPYQTTQTCQKLPIKSIRSPTGASTFDFVYKT